jgi:hypothetical protein
MGNAHDTFNPAEISQAHLALLEGDIFRWSYRDSGPNDHGYGVYHCCSRIAVVTNGRLRDTFWSSGGDGRSFGPEQLAHLNLERLGNFADLIKAPEWQADYYDDADIVNLNHSNSSRDNFYLRVGAVRSTKKMLEAAKHKLERLQSDKRMAEWGIERITKAIIQIETGETEGVHI